MAGFRLAGLALAATGGYLAGRRHRELVAFVERLRGPQDGPLARVRGWEDETEYEHELEREAAQRHTLAEEIKRHPLRPRAAGRQGKERKGWPGRPQRPDDELRYPRSY